MIKEIPDFRITLSDYRDGETRYLWCKKCHNIIVVTPPKMCLTKFEGDISDMILMNMTTHIDARCKKCLSQFVEIHADTINAHLACASMGIDIYYDYGEAIYCDDDIATRNWKGDRPIFRYPSLEILGLGENEKVKECMNNILSRHNYGLILRQMPGYVGNDLYIKYDSLIRVGLPKDVSELCSKEYFDKKNKEINYCRNCIEAIIEELLACDKKD